jgi:Protein of unknown function (DUF3617)
MTTVHRVVVSTLFSASLAAVAFAQAPALNVKMGLWEITSVTDIGGQMPGIDTSKMTPEQKQRMEAAMKGMMGPHSNVTKTCMTKEKFNKSNFMTGGDGDQTCKQTLSTNTPTTLDANVVCTGERAMSGQMHVEALSPTSFKGTMKSANSERGKTMTLLMNMTGKWLAADCGDVD